MLELLPLISIVSNIVIIPALSYILNTEKRLTILETKMDELKSMIKALSDIENSHYRDIINK